MSFSYLFEEVNQIHQPPHKKVLLVFLISKTGNQKRSDTLDQMARPRLSAKRGFPTSLSSSWHRRRFKVNTLRSLSSRSLLWGPGRSVPPWTFVLMYRCQHRVIQASVVCLLYLAALKHAAPPTLVLSCIPHICAVAQISLLSPQASAARRLTGSHNPQPWENTLSY